MEVLVQQITRKLRERKIPESNCFVKNSTFANFIKTPENSFPAFCFDAPSQAESL